MSHMLPPKIVFILYVFKQPNKNMPDNYHANRLHLSNTPFQHLFMTQNIIFITHFNI